MLLCDAYSSLPERCFPPPLREMTPSGGYLSGLLWVVVLMHVAGGVAYYRAYAHLKKQTKVV